MSQGMKSCQYCGELIKAVTKKSKHCEEYLDQALRRDHDEQEAPSHDAALGLVLPIGHSGVLSKLIRTSATIARGQSNDKQWLVKGMF
jgi:hypothetical protein